VRAGLELGGAEERLNTALEQSGPLVIGFSGGADSALLSYVARRQLGRSGALCVTAVSPSLAAGELEECRLLAKRWDLDWEPVETHELENAAYSANGFDRCYHCKSELMEALVPRAAARGAAVALGVNLDDLGDHRPGQLAARERGALFPLVTARLTKKEVRELSARLGLETFDKPAAACLASRLPYGTPVSLGLLNQVGAAEAGLKRLGFRALRVRHYGELARVEVPLSDLERLVRARAEVLEAVKGAGYRYVTVDLEGLRSGNLNDALSKPARPLH
jgi:uncharacterized protein